jgi:hypothetical protein
MVVEFSADNDSYIPDLHPMFREMASAYELVVNRGKWYSLGGVTFFFV